MYPNQWNNNPQYYTDQYQFPFHNEVNIGWNDLQQPFPQNVECYRHHDEQPFQQNVNGFNYGQQSFQNHANHRGQFPQNDGGWNGVQQHSPNGYQSQKENYNRLNKMKRPRDYNEANGGPNKAKKQKFSEVFGTVQYAFKKFSQYQQPMRKVLEMLFESEITAEGWERRGDRFGYHATVRGNYYFRVASSVNNAREQAADNILRDLCNFKFEKITWPRNLISFRLDQIIADAIEQ